MLIINSGTHRFLSLWPSVQTYMDWTLFQASFLVVKRCLKPVRASWHKPPKGGVHGHAWQTQFQPQLHELGPVEVEPTGGFGGTGYCGQHPSQDCSSAAAGVYAKKSQPGRSQVLQRQGFWALVRCAAFPTIPGRFHSTSQTHWLTSLHTAQLLKLHLPWRKCFCSLFPNPKHMLSTSLWTF